MGGVVGRRGNIIMIMARKGERGNLMMMGCRWDSRVTERGSLMIMWYRLWYGDVE